MDLVNQSQGNILVDNHGYPLNIFIQVDGLNHRRKLLRTLREAGALVNPVAANAQILLIDSSTKEGRQILRGHNADSQKIVLEYTWVHKCLEVGRPLFEQENWGGALAADDGLQLDNNEDDEVEQLVSNPLPTPRVTPPGLTTHRSTNSPALLPAANHAPVAQHVPAPPHSQMQITPRAIPQNTITPQLSLFPQLPQPSTSSMPPPYLSQQVMSSSQALPLMNGANGMNGQWEAQQNQYSVMMTFLDVMRHQNLNLMNLHAWSGHSTPAQPPPPMPSQMQPAPTYPAQAPTFLHQGSSHEALPSDDMDSEAEFNLHMNVHSEFDQSQPVLRQRSPSRSPSTVMPPPTKRKRPRPTQSTPTIKPSRKGKERAVSPVPSEASVAISEASASVSSHPESAIQPSTPPARVRTILHQKPSGQIFTTDSGEPLCFFVQVDLQGRHGVVSAIKKNKGRIVNNVNEADYTILSSRSTTFPGLLREAQSVDKLVIQAAFVSDCVAEGALLDETDYALDAVPQTRNAPRSQPQMSMKKPTRVKNTKKAPQSRGSKKPETNGSSSPSKEGGSSFNGRRSPSPPPPDTRVTTTGGKYLFTDAEVDYFGQYAKFLLDQDPTISATAIGNRIYKKMSHHPLSSWQKQISGKLKFQLEKLRKKANIAKRKAMSMQPLPQPPPQKQQQSLPLQLEEDRVDPGSSKKPRLNPSPEALIKLGEIDPEDFDVICHFFAEGGGDDDDNDRVWANLAAYRPCRSAVSWPEFYKTHTDQVFRRIQELYNEKQTGAGP
ncbi:hypothetical protein BJ138DRAFT_1059946 [Hygrophoropsis aurantiaca]|uniref:Uncharacterized protein n=1 Tax=Hygrophoropsis aurantiaca TaxID=72124 RepID=A0ACB8AJA6_9AGAM|nr:hypothetical protein BJ138DRAFT_1059946 [Hygrophoropsis aurantiaca]